MNTMPTSDRAQALRWFQALSDETRLQIVELLAGGECCVCDLQDSVGAYQSRLSFHLRKLKDAGVVADRREGRWVYYSLNPEVFEAMGEYLQVVRSTPQRGGCCGSSGPACCG
jgi:ArsR family transcriptional regulator